MRPPLFSPKTQDTVCDLRGYHGSLFSFFSNLPSQSIKLAPSFVNTPPHPAFFFFSLSHLLVKCSDEPRAETLSHLLWGKQWFSELISWQGSVTPLKPCTASVLLPKPVLTQKKKKSSRERESEQKPLRTEHDFRSRKCDSSCLSYVKATVDIESEAHITHCNNFLDESSALKDTFISRAKSLAIV